tara:strand:+ start:45 stop:2348 length:2304 start_codon:yes stop_codon:yes gene_type:complete
MAWSANKSKTWFKTGADGFGLKDIERAIKEGASYNDLHKLKARANELGLEKGGKVDAFLNYGFTNPDEASHKSLGQKDINEFNKRGYSKELRWALFEKHKAERSKNSDLKIGPTAIEYEKDLKNHVINNRATYKKQIENKVKTLYKKHLGRDADAKGLAKYTDNLINQGWDESKLASTLTNSPEGKQHKVGSKVIPKTGATEGASATLFGPADYYKLLKNAKIAGKDLTQVRKDVMTWIENMPKNQIGKKISKVNAKGGGGLYDWISQSVDKGYDKQNIISHKFGDYSKDAKAGDTITEADILAAQAGGKSRFDTYRWMHHNKSKWEADPQASTYYRELRNGLIKDGNHNYRKEGGKYRYLTADNMLKHPLWYEMAHMKGYIPAESHKWDYKNLKNAWTSSSTYSRKVAAATGRDKHKEYTTVDGKKVEKTGRGGFKFIKETLERLYPDKGSRHKMLSTDAQLRQLTGTGTSTSLTWQKGEYWQQYGASGPPDQPNDGDEIPDLGKSQVLVGAAAAGGFESKDAQERLESLENRFLTELYGKSVMLGRKVDDSGTPKYLEAKDSWGLDIMRLDKDGNALKLDTNVWEDGKLKKGASVDSWYETLTKGTINWAYYKDSDLYKLAQKSIGMDDTIDTVQEIRAANIWVQAYQSKDEPDSDAPPWIQHKASFERQEQSDGSVKFYEINGNKKTEVTSELNPQTLTINDYAQQIVGDNVKKGEDEGYLKKMTKPSTTGPAKLSVNIPSVTIKRPTSGDYKTEFKDLGGIRT